MINFSRVTRLDPNIGFGQPINPFGSSSLAESPTAMPKLTATATAISIKSAIYIKQTKDCDLIGRVELSSQLWAWGPGDLHFYVGC